MVDRLADVNIVSEDAEEETDAQEEESKGQALGEVTSKANAKATSYGMVKTNSRLHGMIRDIMDPNEKIN